MVTRGAFRLRTDSYQGLVVVARDYGSMGLVKIFMTFSSSRGKENKMAKKLFHACWKMAMRLGPPQIMALAKDIVTDESMWLVQRAT
jgi:hypothetical protein